jgi:hypothetical protein
MLIVPVQSVPSQQLQVTLAGQVCQINIYEKSTGLFMDLYVSGVLIIGGVLCLNRNVIVRDVYFGFTGDFAFIDTQGADDPTYTGIGARFLLYYLSPSDLASAGLAA